MPTYEADVRFAVRFLIDRGIRGALDDPRRVDSGARGRPRGRPGVRRAPARPRRLDAPALGPLLRHRDRPGGREPAVGGAPRMRRLGGPHARPRGHAAARRGWRDTPRRPICSPPSPTGCGRSTRTCSPAGTWSTSTCACSPPSRSATAVCSSWAAGRARSASRGAWRRGPSRASVPGRVVLDGIQLLRGASVRMESYGLDAVAREVLGEGKTLAGGDGGREILRLFEEDRAALAEYNRTDARLALEILERMQLVELAVARSRLTGLAPDRMGASIAAFDFLYLAELGRRGKVAPTVGLGDEEPGEHGGRPRPRAAARALRERPGVRLQEPLPEPDPHLRARPDQPARRRGGRAGGPGGPERRRLPARARHPAGDARRALPAPGGGAAGGRPGRRLRDQDPDELVLRRARHPRLPLPQPGGGERDHRLRPPGAALDARDGSRSAARGCSTATPTACSSSRARRTRRRRGGWARSWRRG